MKYETDSRFDTYYLEDSYVLGLDERETSKLAFSLQVVLTPNHPLYATPPPSDHHCYRAAMLTFEWISAVNWIERLFRPFRSADGSVDYGNIDVFEIDPDDHYYLEGDWGRLALIAKNSYIVLA